MPLRACIVYVLRGLDSNQEYPAPKAGVLPLNDPASYGHTLPVIFERRTGIEPVTFSLARRHSTGELTPLYCPNAGYYTLYHDQNIILCRGRESNTHNLFFRQAP